MDNQGSPKLQSLKKTAVQAACVIWVWLCGGAGCCLRRRAGRRLISRRGYLGPVMKPFWPCPGDRTGQEGSSLLSNSQTQMGLFPASCMTARACVVPGCCPFLATPWGMQDLSWPRRLSLCPCVGSMESSPVAHQGAPCARFLRTEGSDSWPSCSSLSLQPSHWDYPHFWGGKCLPSV